MLIFRFLICSPDILTGDFIITISKLNWVESPTLEKGFITGISNDLGTKPVREKTELI